MISSRIFILLFKKLSKDSHSYLYLKKKLSSEILFIIEYYFPFPLIRADCFLRFAELIAGVDALLLVDLVLLFERS
jgi:hypothetical protein